MPIRLTARSVATSAIVAVATVFVLLQFQPGLLVANTTPAGGDMGAHVWGPAFLRDHLLPQWRLSGWSPDWYNGFPAYHFYFPLPSLAIVVLDAFLAYGVAFKLVTVVGPVTLPASAYAMGRLMRLPFPTPALLSLGTVPFIFDRYHTIWGGNAAATLAGEFAFAIALSLALLYVGLFHRAVAEGRGHVLAGIVLAATGLCHLLPAAFAAAASLVILALRRPNRQRLAIAAVTGGLGLALAAVWLVPFLARLPYSNDMGWERTYAYVDNLFPFLRTDDAASPGTTRHLYVTMPLALVGAVLGLVRRRNGAAVLTALAVGAALAFWLIPEGPIWNARVLPFWYLATYLLAAVALGEAAAWLGEPERGRAAAASPGLIIGVAALCATLLVTGIPLGVFASGRLELPGDRTMPFPRVGPEVRSSFIPDWAAWNYSGYERKDAYDEYRDIVRTMEGLAQTRGCGRAMWEYEPELNRHGTPMGLMLLPMWTDGCIGSMEGLFFESSATVPYHFLNQSELSNRPSRAMRGLPYRGLDVAAGVEHLKLLGVRYYLAISPEAQSQAAEIPDLIPVATTSPRDVTYDDGVHTRYWQVYEVRGGVRQVTPLDHLPAVVTEGMEGKEGWIEGAVPWYQDSSRWAVPLATDGPGEWPRVDRATSIPPRQAIEPARVSNIYVTTDRISFDVDEPGRPVLVKASYFPNWSAVGARGPWRVTPNSMVVIPTDRHVELRYGRTPVDWAALAITLLAVAAAVVLARRGPIEIPDPPPPPRVEEHSGDAGGAPLASGADSGSLDGLDQNRGADGLGEGGDGPERLVPVSPEQRQE